MISLFGDEIPNVAPKPQTAKKGGHYAAPGTGPEGESCGTCRYAVRRKLSSKSVYKCELARRCWTHGPGSDIRLKDPACGGWRAEVNLTAEDGEERRGETPNSPANLRDLCGEPRRVAP